jgi:hypothetical protein
MGATARKANYWLEDYSIQPGGAINTSDYFEPVAPQRPNQKTTKKQAAYSCKLMEVSEMSAAFSTRFL